MAGIWEKAISILAGNLNSGLSSFKICKGKETIWGKNGPFGAAECNVVTVVKDLRNYTYLFRNKLFRIILKT